MWVLNFGLATFFSFTLLLGIAQADSTNKKSDQTEDNEKFFIAEDGELERLGAAAQQRGWRVERDNEGNMLLFPQTNAATQPANIEPSIKVVDQKIDATDLDTLQKAIADRGWGTGRDDQGNLLLYPPGLENNASIKTSANVELLDKKPPVIEKPGKDNLADDQPDHATSIAGTKDTTAPDIEKSTAADRENDTPSKTTSSEKSLTTKTPDSRKPAKGDLDLLEKMLQARGWSTSRNKAGNLLLYPASPEKQTQSPSPKKQKKGLNVLVGSCEYGETKLNMGEKISLPVDRWAEAREISLAWLAQSKEEGEIGRIRKVNRLYIVSIVAEGAPRTLLKQLIIHSLDGQVISVP